MHPATAPTLSDRIRAAFEGELARMPPHERREQQRRQVRMLHGPLSNLLLALAVLQGIGLGVALAGHGGTPAGPWRIVGVGLLFALALGYRRIVSVRRRRVAGFAFVGVLVACVTAPAPDGGALPLVSLAGLLLLPIAFLPLLVGPGSALGGLAACTAMVAGVLWQAQAPDGETLAFAAWFATSAVAGLVLRRARANLAIRLDREVESLWQRAVSDGLTGLLNRQGWMNLAGAALAEAVRDGRQPAVLFIDVDHFKRTNDAHGHLAGDELLRMLGRVIEERLGPGELAARLGGEEFAVLVPDADVPRAAAFARRLADGYRERARDFGSTLSIGVTLHAPGDLLNDLLARADAALYAAKRNGRDQVVFADSD